MFKKLLIFLLLLVNIVVILLLWACCAITMVDSTSVPRLAVLCLTFPIILVLNLVFIPVWLVFKWRMTLVPLVGVLLCLNFILDYFPLHSQKQQTEDASITVLSWNVMNFNFQGFDERHDEIIAYIDSVSPDIVCLQECTGGSFAPKLMQHMTDAGYQCAEHKGRALYSRFPVISEEELNADSWLNNGVNVYKLLVGDDTLLVMNTHLESNFLTKEDKYDGRMALKSADRNELEQKGRHIWAKLAVSQRYRGAQVDTVTHALDTRFAGMSTIMCGDFNDTPISYAYQQMKRFMQSAYRSKGFGVGVSYNERFFYFRIDHLFHSSDWETVSAHIDNHFLASDHYPLIVKLRKR